MDVTHQQLAEALKNARPNLFGSIEAIREVKLLKRGANPFPNGKMYKRYRIVNTMTFGRGSYASAIQNEHAKQGQQVVWESRPRSGMHFWDDSRVILVHNTDISRKYISLRQVRNTAFECQYVDSQGHVHEYENIEPYMLKSEKRETRQAQRRYLAAHQNLPLEAVVIPFCFKMKHLTCVVYGGTAYNVIPQPTESVSRAANERFEDIEEMDFVNLM